MFDLYLSSEGLGWVGGDGVGEIGMWYIEMDGIWGGRGGVGGGGEERPRRRGERRGGKKDLQQR